MDIVYSIHAKDQMKERKIEKVWVEEAVKSPDHTIRDRKKLNKYIVKKKLNGRSIEIVYLREKYINIVTVYWI